MIIDLTHAAHCPLCRIRNASAPEWVEAKASK